MTNSTIQTIVNSAAIKHAESQYRLARYFTPFNFEPERIDFDRVACFTGNVMEAFPDATGNLQAALERTQEQLNEAGAVLQVFEEQGTEPTLSEDELFQTASANVRQPNMARYSTAA